MWKNKKLPPFLDSNQAVADALLLYGKKTMEYPNLLEGVFHYFHEKVFPYFLKLMNPPSLTNHNDITSLIEDEERTESKIHLLPGKISLSPNRLMVQ